MLVGDVLVDTDSEVEYTPQIEGYVARIKCRRLSDDAVWYISLNPSGGSDDAVPTVFVYTGETGDPAIDGADVHYVCEFPDLDTENASYEPSVRNGGPQ